MRPDDFHIWRPCKVLLKLFGEWKRMDLTLLRLYPDEALKIYGIYVISYLNNHDGTLY